MAKGKFEMKAVEPIRDLNKFMKMQELMHADGKLLELLLLRLMYNTNLRVSDALLIKWVDVLDSSGNALTDWSISEKKTKKYKWIPMTPQLAESLESFYKNMNRLCENLFLKLTRKDLSVIIAR